MTIQMLDKLPKEQAFRQLFNCCGSTEWVKKMLLYRPFQNSKSLMVLAEKVWFDDCSPRDWIEAFGHHPKIGDIKSLEKKFSATRDWAGNEQAGVRMANKATLESLATGNEAYEKKFGYIFIVCATGKTAEEMLHLLQKRLPNDPATELEIAMREQHKITEIRLKKLIEV